MLGIKTRIVNGPIPIAKLLLDNGNSRWYFGSTMNGTTFSVTDLKQKTALAIDYAVKKGEPLVILQRSKPVAVLTDYEYFKALEEAVLDFTDTREAEKAKREPKDPLEKYIKKRWGRM